MFSKVNRRTLLAGAAASALVTATGSALAMTSASATALVDKVVSDINTVINSGKSENAMFGDFERIFQNYAAVAVISQAVLGPDWRAASNGQKQAFANALKVYLSRKYGRRFRDFIGGRIEVQSAKANRRGFDVQSRAVLRGQSPFSVVFRVAQISGRDQFYDIVIEGISLARVEKEEIGAMLEQRRNDLNALINDLPRAA